MALRPDKNASDDDRKAVQKAASDEALLREVDEALRQDRYSTFGRRYGIIIAVVLIVGLAGFGGYLWWQSSQESAAERDSEVLVTALDQLEAGNQAAASDALDPLVADGSAGARAMALMVQAGLAAQRDETERAATLFNRVADDDDVPEPIRALASIRAVAAQYDTMQPAQVIARLEPLAQPDNAFFGSAGELVAMAYLDQGNTARAGELFAQIANNEGTPESLRSRSRQMAGMLGVDAVEDVDAIVAQARRAQGASGEGAAPAAAR